MILWSYQKKHKSSLPLKMINQVQQGKNKPKINLSNKTKHPLPFNIIRDVNRSSWHFIFWRSWSYFFSLLPARYETKSNEDTYPMMNQLPQKENTNHEFRMREKTKQVCMLPLGSSSSWQEKQQAKFYHCRNNKLDLIIIL